MVQYVSLDGIAAIMFKLIFKTRVVFYALGSDILKINEHAVIFPLVNWLVERSDYVFCSSNLIETTIKSWGFTSRLKAIPSIVNLADFESNNSSIAKKWDIITVGRLDSNKNQILLIKACVSLPNFNLLIVGDGGERRFFELESSQKKLNATFLGNIPHKQVFKEMQRSLIYVHTSKSEGLPVTILEAMFVGLPVIVVDSPYAHALSAYGLKFNITKASPHDLSNAILDVYRNYSIALENSKINKQLVSEMISETFQDLTEVLDSLIQTNNYAT
jgi:glycosyltransferase involved in cell wall biosynthesis